MADLSIVAGSAHRRLADDVARLLGASTLSVERRRFPDGELDVRLADSPRGRTAVVIQPTGPNVDEHLVELLALTDACRRSGAEQVVAVVPYFGYARGDRRAGKRIPIMASLVAQLMQLAGVRHIITVDLHAPQIEGFFEVPLDNLLAHPSLLEAIGDGMPRELAVVSPDLGRLAVATQVADELGTVAAVVHKRRSDGTETVALQVVGDVKGRSCLIIDDMITTGETIRGAAEALHAAGAGPDIFVAATHGLFVDGAIQTLRHSRIRRIWVTDTLSQAHGAEAASRQAGGPAISVVPVAPLLAEAISSLG